MLLYCCFPVSVKLNGDDREQLRTAAANGKSISYSYNSDGIRTGKTMDGVATNYLLDGSTIIAQKSGDDILWFLYDSDGTRVGFTYNGTAYYYTTDAQGDVTGIVDSNVNTVVEYSYDPWGKLLSTTGSLADTIGRANPFLYRGYCYDAETGLYYLNSRYYDPQTGRFLNADGAVSTGTGILGHNMFAYCNNDPTGLADNGGSRPMAISENGIESIEDQIIAAKFNSEAHRKTALYESHKSSAKSASTLNRLTTFGSNVVQGVADAKLGKAISKLPKYITKIKRVGPGVGIELEFYTRSTSSAFFKSFAKIGIVAAGAFIWDLYTDSMAYRGNDFYKAATVSTIAFAIGISVGLLAAGAGVPVGITLLAGIASGTIIGSVEDPIKKQWIGY